MIFLLLLCFINVQLSCWFLRIFIVIFSCGELQNREANFQTLHSNFKPLISVTLPKITHHPLSENTNKNTRFYQCNDPKTLFLAEPLHDPYRKESPYHHSAYPEPAYPEPAYREPAYHKASIFIANLSFLQGSKVD